MGSITSVCSKVSGCPSGTCENPSTSCRKKSDCYPIMKKVSQQTVRDLCMEYFSGTWYAVARYNHPWEASCAKTSYVFNWDCVNNVMHMETNCFEKDGVSLIENHKGILTFKCPENRGKLTLKMPSMKKSEQDEDTWPYWVHYVLYDKYAIVGGPSGKYVWVLSRSPYLPASDIDWILRKVNYFGYCADQLITFKELIKPCECASCSSNLN